VFCFSSCCYHKIRNWRLRIYIFFKIRFQIQLHGAHGASFSQNTARVPTNRPRFGRWSFLVSWHISWPRPRALGCQGNTWSFGEVVFFLTHVGGTPVKILFRKNVCKMDGWRRSVDVEWFWWMSWCFEWCVQIQQQELLSGTNRTAASGNAAWGPFLSERSTSWEFELMGCCLMFRTTLICIENDVFQWLVPRPRPCFNVQIVGILNEKIGRVWWSPSGWPDDLFPFQVVSEIAVHYLATQRRVWHVLVECTSVWILSDAELVCICYTCRCVI